MDTSCDGTPVTCKHCGDENVFRKHERLSCDEAPVTCEFQDVGCNPNPVIVCCCLCVLCSFSQWL